MAKFNSDACRTEVGGVQQLLHDANLYVVQNHFAIFLAQPSTFNMVQPWVARLSVITLWVMLVTGGGFGDGGSDRCLGSTNP